MKDYQSEAILMIREFSDRLNEKSNTKLVALYHEWSENIASASWLMPSDNLIATFCEWATTAPCDRAPCIGEETDE